MQPYIRVHLLEDGAEAAACHSWVAKKVSAGNKPLQYGTAIGVQPQQTNVFDSAEHSGLFHYVWLLVE
jgi:hypothetical protein